MHGNVFAELSLVMAVAAGLAMLMRALKQPLIMAYIITGVIVGPWFLNAIKEQQAFDAFSEIGIALLLFIVGLELSAATIRRLGRPVFLTAAALLAIVGSLGYLFATAMQFTPTEALITGLALFFSSTIIIAKVLSDKKELTRLNGQIAIGVILLDDIIATLALLFVGAAGSSGPLQPADLGILALKGAAIVGVLFVMGAKVLPRLTSLIARSQEMLFIFALAWGFGIASLVNVFGFSVEVGALFAGVTLAHLPYASQIGAKLKPLRDFFIILFFISLGKSLELSNLESALVPALVLSLIVLVVKPLTVMTSLGILGYTKRTSFKTGINLSQISEFSIILVVLAASTGLVSTRLSAIITLVAITTITVSTYFMAYDNWIYAKLERHLHLFQREGVEDAKPAAKHYPLILFGYQNGGHAFVKTFRDLKKPFVVVDYDPEVIDDLQHKRLPYVYGDATDPELLAEIGIDQAELIVNTIGDHSINLSLVEHVRRLNPAAVIICYSHTPTEALELYELGATYVTLPQFVGSEHLSAFIGRHGLSRGSFEDYRKRHATQLNRAILHAEN